MLKNIFKNGLYFVQSYKSLSNVSKCLIFSELLHLHSAANNAMFLKRASTLLNI